MTENSILPSDWNSSNAMPTLSRRLRLGVVGGGRISQTQAAAARLTNCWEIVAGALTSKPELVAQKGRDWFLDADRSYSSFQDMAKAEAERADGVDAVMITTPNHLHHDAAIAFLESGINVLCDKPLTNETSEARALVTKAKETGLVFAVGYAMSCFPMVRQAREIVTQGGIGKINQIHVEFLQDWMTPDDVADAAHVKWRLDPKTSGPTSCVGDIGTHAAHIASFVSGLEMSEVKAEMHVCGSPKPLEDTVFMMTRFGVVPGTLIATRLAPGNRGGLRLRIFGSKGGIEWNLEDAERLKFNQYGQPDQIISRGHGHGVSLQTEKLVRSARGFPEGIFEAWANLYQEFAIAVAARIDGVTADDLRWNFPQAAAGAKGVEFIEAVVRSDKSGGVWTKI